MAAKKPEVKKDVTPKPDVKKVKKDVTPKPDVKKDKKVKKDVTPKPDVKNGPDKPEKGGPKKLPGDSAREANDFVSDPDRNEFKGLKVVNVRNSIIIEDPNDPANIAMQLTWETEIDQGKKLFSRVSGVTLDDSYYVKITKHQGGEEYRPQIVDADGKVFENDNLDAIVKGKMCNIMGMPALKGSGAIFHISIAPTHGDYTGAATKVIAVL
jgi:hypothetical protein